ncbi:2,4-dihydroxyhept-2-ene-1,7-dioic acid aldolase [Baekduia soli]|uniref:2,4-dihydroxyhept-2-ene-1,7-dioic acid aldolase n=1 Tax=Baekduia soli TaxID=496014 RepID=A0A5B8UBM3_9ACTN|nr:aldolase/citrate lyase family protein [Baekduia soli]QEC50440.1 2,4-dihydroxyhept-2-ene-1,7-dioic acid aldolase [Baekduia soli]
MGATGLRERLRRGDVLAGTFLNLGSALAAEACGVAGLDWVLIDLEHGSGSEGDLLAQLHGARAGGVHAVVRVESAERPRAGRALDLGAEGIMVPRIDGVQEARAAVAHLHYAPHGDRGVATYNRACAFGTRPQAIAEAARHTVGIVQIETPAAVAAAGDIAALDGVDALFVGPGDLSHAMGAFGRVDAPEFQQALRTVVAAADAHGKAAGILVPGHEAVPGMLALGFTLIAVGSDSTLMVAGARAAAAAVHAT